MKTLLLIIAGYSAGVAIGTALSALISLLQLIPRLVQFTDTRDKVKLYEWTFIVSTILFSFLYFTDLSFHINKYINILFGLFNGLFVGLFTSALAEVLNVMPIMTEKLNLKNYLFYLLSALISGKVLGSLYYWLVFVKR